MRNLLVFERVSLYCTNACRVSETDLKPARAPLGSQNEKIAKSAAERRHRRQLRRQRSHSLLRRRGWVEILLERKKRWSVINFVEQAHAQHHEQVLAELETLRPMWDSALNPLCWWEDGHEACKRICERLEPIGIRVWDSNLPSIAPLPPYVASGHRFYVSVDKAFARQLGGTVEADPLPAHLRERLWPGEKGGYIRNMGWVLAPPGSPAQNLHQDWSQEGLAHIIWKRSPGRVTTEIVDGRFGSARSEDYERIARADGAAILFLSNVLHRGAAVLGTGWGCSLSVELCSEAGQRRWEATESREQVRNPDYTVMTIRDDTRGLHVREKQPEVPLSVIQGDN